jgi:hypothetical protein
LKRHPLVQQAEAAGVTLWLDNGRVRWKAAKPPPTELLAALRERRDEVAEALRPSPGATTLLAFMKASAEALAEREEDPVEEAERAAIYDLPPPAPARHASSELPAPKSVEPSPAARQPLWEHSTMEGRTLALLRTPGVEVLVERDGWLRISTPDGVYALCQRETAEHVGWRG